MKANCSTNSTMPPLPDDLRRVLWKRNVLPFLLYLAWLMILTAVSIWVIYPHIKGTDSMVVAPTVYVAACILPIFLLKLPQKLTDRTFMGTVSYCKPYTRLYREVFRTNFKGEPIYLPYAELVIETDSGKLIPMDLPLPDIYAPPPWKVGDRVAHFRGSRHLILADKLPTTCIVCYGISPEGEDKCVFCGHSLVKDS